MRVSSDGRLSRDSRFCSDIGPSAMLINSTSSGDRPDKTRLVLMGLDAVDDVDIPCRLLSASRERGYLELQASVREAK